MEAIKESLRFDVFFFFCQMGLFLVLLVILNQIFWKPMLAHLRLRDQGIKDAYKTVEDSRHEMETLRADYQARIIKIEADARAHIQQAIKEAQAERERIISEARALSDATIKQGAEDMEREKTDALANMSERMTAMALAAVGKALGQGADSTALRASIQNSIAAKN
jgi:F-type H+-transporting ATPase subunit b